MEVWTKHVSNVQGKFRRMYRMSYCSFCNLVHIIDPIFFEKSLNTWNIEIITEIKLHCVLRWLAGGSYLDIEIINYISDSTFYKTINRIMLVIVNCDVLEHKTILKHWYYF